MATTHKHNLRGRAISFDHVYIRGFCKLLLALMLSSLFVNSTEAHNQAFYSSWRPSGVSKSAKPSPLYKKPVTPCHAISLVVQDANSNNAAADAIEVLPNASSHISPVP